MFDRVLTPPGQTLLKLKLKGFNKQGSAESNSINRLQSSLREKCPYSEFFWSVFSRIWTEYGEILLIGRMRENMDQKNSEYGRFLHTAFVFSLLYECTSKLCFEHYSPKKEYDLFYPL